MPTLNKRSVINPAMASGIYPSNFSTVFSRLLEKTGVSCYQIKQFTQLNEGYLSRLRTGERNNPSPETVFKIGLAFMHLSKDVKLHDVERLLNSVGRSMHVQSDEI